MGIINQILPGFDELSANDPIELLSMLGFPIVLGLSIALMINALYGYRIFKYTLATGGAIGFGIVGHSLLGTLLVSALDDAAILNAISIPSIIGILCALIGGAVMFALYKLAIFLTGAVGGYFLGSMFTVFLSEKLPDVEFLQGKAALYIISIACALLAGILFLLLFKLLYIILTSVGGLTLAGALIGSVLTPAPNIVVIIVFGVFGFVAGLFATVKQFRDADSGV